MKKVSYLVDIWALAGCIAVLYGVEQIHRPSAWILGGLMALAGAIFISCSGTKNTPRGA